MKIGKSSIIFENVYLKSSAVVVGPKEKKGPLEKYFDYKYDFSFLMINRLADGLLMKILYQNKMISDNNKLLEYINTLPFKTRIKIVMKAADMFMYKVIHKIKMIL